MLRKSKITNGLAMGAGLTSIALLVAGCGAGLGGGSFNYGSPITGVVADGYLSGTKVCLDKNSNGVCDTGEPYGTSDANGAYSIIAGSTGVFTDAERTQYPIVAEVPSTSIDKDTGTAVGTSFALTSPAGASFVSPITTLVQNQIANGISSASAVAAVNTTLGISAASGVSALDNYIALTGTATDQTSAPFKAHEAAKVVAAVFKQGKSNLGSGTTASTDQTTQGVLAEQAQAVLEQQKASNSATPGTLFSVASVTASSVSSASTLKASIAGANVPAATAATQAVTLNFDLINGATAVGTTGCSTPITVGTGSTAGTLAAAKFYVSRVALIDSNGGYSPVRLTENSNQGRGVALLNFENSAGTCAVSTAAAYTAIVGTVVPAPSGTTYVGVAFTVGVPQYSTDGGTRVLLNHSDNTASTTPLPLQDTGMAWSWQSGRKFSRIEFLPTGAASSAKTMVHLGSTGCTANPAVSGTVVTPCAGPNNVAVTFTTGFNAATNKIAFDLGSLFGGLNFATSQTWMSGRVAGMMTANPVYYYGKYQLDITTGLPINGGITASTTNPLFVIK